MLRFFVFLFVILFTQSSAQIQWLSISGALEAQEKHPKKILIHFEAPDCKACQTLSAQTFNTPEIQQYIQEYFYAVKFNVQTAKSFQAFGKEFSTMPSKGQGAVKTHEFARFMNITSFPSLAFLDEQSMPITTVQGVLTAKELEPYLVFFGRGDYLKITTSEQWENYRKRIKSKIKD